MKDKDMDRKEKKFRIRGINFTIRKFSKEQIKKIEKYILQYTIFYFAIY